jgi:hypothetical protein
MKRKLTLITIWFVMLTICFSIYTSAQETEARMLSGNDFQLSTEAVAAGIDGKIWMGLTINADGSSSDIRVYGGPMWPCGAKMPRELEEVRRAVKQHVQSLRFEPARKDGKPRSSSVFISFLLTESFRNAADTKQIEEHLKKGINPPMVEVPDISTYALSVPKQLMGTRGSPSARLAEMQLLVDENGTVIKAGGFKNAREDVVEAQKLACAAKFKKLTLNRIPVKMSGTLLYGLY